MEFLPQLAKTTKQGIIYIAKKGANYITVINGELRASKNQMLAIAFETKDSLQTFIDIACIDDRNAQVIGRSYKVQEIIIVNRK